MVNNNTAIQSGMLVTKRSVNIVPLLIANDITKQDRFFFHF